MSWDNWGPTVEEGIAKAEAAARADRERRAREEADHMELAALGRRVQRGDVDAYRPLIECWARIYNKRIVWVHSNPRAVGDVAHLRYPDDDEKLAEAGHELAHLIAEKCEGPLHAAFTEEGTHECLRCEVAAWEIALRVVPFSRVAFHRLQTALATYRRSTPAPAAVKAQADRMMSEAALVEHQQRWHARQWRLELQHRVAREVEAESARSRARWERLHG